MVRGRGDKRESPQEEQLEQQQQEEPVGATGLERASMHQEITMYDELMRRLDHVTLKLREYKTKNQELEARLRAAEDRDRPAASPPPPAPLPIFNVVVDKESIPPFRGDTPAAQPLRRNQEVEAWIRHIENVAKPATDATFISAARASCKGPADLIVNSPMFDGIREWAIFKTLLRRKFRGTCSSTDFFTILNECRMTTTQGPQDFFQQLEGIVYQGVRDYPDVVGNPEPLLKRLFLQGLPLWLREYLIIASGSTENAKILYRTRWWPSERSPASSCLFSVPTGGHLDCPFPPSETPVAEELGGGPLQYPRSSDTGAIGRNSLNPHLQPTSRTTDGGFKVPREHRLQSQRLDFRLGYDSRTNNSYLRLRGKAFTVRYVNKDSLELTAVVMKMKGMSVPVPPARAAIRRSVSCRQKVEVKLRNGTHLVELHEVEEMCDTPEAPGNVASIADTPVAAVPTSALEKISLQHLSDHPGEDAHCKLREALDVARKAAQEASRKARQEYAAYHNRNLRPPWSSWVPGPVSPFSERNCHANQLRPFKLEEELTFPDASPYHDPDYVDPWLPDDAEPGATMLLSAIRPSQHAPQSW
ncbi:hypothetical protein C7M84_011867 [Penaeus vannamei]|uniref:Retrotransposon gag domain-containing protein n=1 Tax=Penaeus vannamei TaxID=6689 RepID=A0A423T0A9_PENVA|nr:hypothetical protein C7M84_011867 [Penaeus vannamei]